MAVDKLVDSTQLNSDLTSVANAIRTKGGTSAQLAFPSGFVSAIGAIPTGGGGGGITRETVEYTFASDTYYGNVPITGDVNKILFAHFYDKDAVYTTTSTTYEGFLGGPALVNLQLLAEQAWCNWRTGSNGTTTGWNNYGGNSFSTDGIVKIGMNPMGKAGHTYVVDVFYAP